MNLEFLTTIGEAALIGLSISGASGGFVYLTDTYLVIPHMSGEIRGQKPLFQDGQLCIPLTGDKKFERRCIDFIRRNYGKG